MELMFFLILVLIVVVIAAWIVSIDLFLKVGAAKGYTMDNKGLLWFIGIFATPLSVGIYVASLPDLSKVAPAGATDQAAEINEQLPEL